MAVQIEPTGPAGRSTRRAEQGRIGQRAEQGRTVRRADAGVVQLSQRDIDGLLLCGEHYCAPYDLLAAALAVPEDRLPAILLRWRRAGFVSVSRLGPGPKWCWLTREGMSATGLGFPAARPALGRLAHIRAVLAVRLGLEANPGWARARPWWHSERRLRSAGSAGYGGSAGGGGLAGRLGHVPDAEVHWPSVPGGPCAGEVWAIEVELTPKTAVRTERIITELVTSGQYARVVYMTAPAARTVVTRTVAELPPWEQGLMVVRDLPASAFIPEPQP